jgi:hypothetical protein
MTIRLFTACYISQGEMNHLPGGDGVCSSQPRLSYLHTLAMWNLEFLSDSLAGHSCECIFPPIFMMRWRMVFRKIIPQILVSWAPIDMTLSLFDPVFDPIEAHIHGPCAFLFYCSIAVSCDCGVVSL